MNGKGNRLISICMLLLLIAITGYAETGSELLFNRDTKTISALEAVEYQWFFNGEELKGEVNQKIKVKNVGIYTVEMNFANGTSKRAQVAYKADNTVVHKIFVIGDSMSSIYGASLYPRTGWGQIMQAFFDTDSILVVDKAMSGRSSKSYYTDAQGWPTVLSEIGEGDYLFIQFGHNDQKAGDKYTDPYTTYQDYLELYIDSARAHGAIPILLTPIHRNGWSGTLINDSHGDYPPAMRALATSKNVPLIDHHSKSKALFESYGQDYTTNKIFMNLAAGIWINYPTGNADDTHVQEEGAYQMCDLIKEGISELTAFDGMKFLKNSMLDASRVIAMASPYLAGDISGIGVYSLGTEATFTAKARNGYIFDNWSEEDTLVSTEFSFSFDVIEQKRDFQANFTKAYEVKLKQTPSFSGILRGNGFYAPGTEITITASPKVGKRFINWQKNDEIVTTDTSYTFTINEEDLTFKATFETVIVSGINLNNGAVSIKAFPNPTRGSVHFSSEESIQSIELLSINGQSLFHSKYNTKDVRLDISKYAQPGWVIVRIATKNSESIIRLVIQE